MRGKSRKAPFPLCKTLTLLLLVLLFGRGKKTNDEEKSRSLPLQASGNPFPVPDSLKKTVGTVDVERARDRLRLASLERDIVGDALTKIYEAEARGLINENEKNQLLQRYKVELKRVDGEVDTQKRVVDLHELESAKEDLLKSFYEKMMEIDLRINQLKPGMIPLSTSVIESKNAKSAGTVANTAQSKEAQPASQQPPAGSAEKDKAPKERPKNKAEERLEAVREEVLKAMERLEQIEAEG